MADPATLKSIKRIDVGRRPEGLYDDSGSKHGLANGHGIHGVNGG